MATKPTKKPKDDKILIVTPRARGSFLKIFEPSAAKKGYASKYEATFLFDKKTDISELRAAAKKVGEAAFGPKDEWEGVRWPFKDGNKKKDLEGYENTIYIKASSSLKSRPKVYDLNNELVDPSDVEAVASIKSGDYFVAKLTVAAYDDMSKGVTFYLNGLRKVKNGAAFGGGGASADDFADVDVDEDDGYENTSESDEDDDGPGF